MDVPDPALAQDVADALTGLADAAEQAAWDLAGTLIGLRLHWSGRAASAAAELVGALAGSSSDTSDGLRQAATTWSGLAADLRAVQAKVQLVDTVSTGAAIWGAVSVLQAGLDPLTDGAAVGEEAAAQGALATARKLLTDSLAKAVGKSELDRAALRALALLYGRRTLGGAAKSALQTSALEQFETGHVHAADVLSPSLALALVPTPLQPYVTAGTSVDPAAPGETPPCFPDRGVYLAAVDAADGWAADHPGALVSVGAGPDGAAQVTVYGGGVRKAAGLTPGRAYAADDLRTADPSLADLLDELRVYVPAGATVVLP